MPAEVVEVLVSDVAEVQLMVADGKHVVIDVLCVWSAVLCCVMTIHQSHMQKTASQRFHNLL